MRIKKSLQELYNQVVSEIEQIREGILKGNEASVGSKITEEEKIALSVKDSKQFRKLVIEELGR